MEFQGLWTRFPRSQGPRDPRPRTGFTGVSGEAPQGHQALWTPAPGRAPCQLLLRDRPCPPQGPRQSIAEAICIVSASHLEEVRAVLEPLGRTRFLRSASMSPGSQVLYQECLQALHLRLQNFIS
ncbi:Cilia- And Flagella-Associated Protein 46 [Manis pentadactyla]|nr:Cilia- And Flagella-Associated Protein 46 [Manis pentadactyla]